MTNVSSFPAPTPPTEAIKYTYNNGNIANDPKLAVNYFINAIEKIPSLIKKYQEETEKLKTDVPVLQGIVSSTWRKDNELNELKTELAVVERKIQLSLKPIDQNEEQPSETQEKKTKKPKHEKTINGKKVISEPKVVVSDNSAKNDTEKDIETIQNLLSGKMKPTDVVPLQSIQQAKEEMGDRLKITSIPTYSIEINSKGFKI